jgi:hypothetical protein
VVRLAPAALGALATVAVLASASALLNFLLEIYTSNLRLYGIHGIFTLLGSFVTRSLSEHSLVYLTASAASKLRYLVTASAQSFAGSHAGLSE